MADSLVDCCIGQTVRVGMPMVSYEPLWTFDPTTQQFGGFIVSLLALLQQMLGFYLSVVLDAAPGAAAEKRGTQPQRTGKISSGCGCGRLQYSGEGAAPTCQTDLYSLRQHDGSCDDLAMMQATTEQPRPKAAC